MAKRRDATFYKEITEKMGVALHYNKVIDSKYFEIEWANQFYKDILEISIEERNRKTKEFHKNSYSRSGYQDILDALKNSEQDKNTYSYLYKYNQKWVITLAKYFKKAPNAPTDYICATADLTICKEMLSEFEMLQKEISRLKDKISVNSLSKREYEILKQIANGRSERETAKTLNRSTHTIKTHIKNIKKKLNLKKNLELVKFALEAGIN